MPDLALLQGYGKGQISGKRMPKVIQWHHNMEIPPGSDYQWANEQPFGDLKGIDEERTRCKLYVANSYPAYLNGLSCTMYSNRRK